MNVILSIIILYMYVNYMFIFSQRARPYIINYK